MNILYTDETFIQFYYGECDVAETFEIEHVLENDVLANNHYASVSEQIQYLQINKKGPKQSSLDNILAHCKI